MNKEKFIREAKPRLLSYEEPLRESIEADDIQDVFLNSVYRDFFTQLDLSGLVEPFDYNAWLAGQELQIESEELIAGADLEFLSKLVTIHMRLDRFIGGHLEKLMKDGYFLKVLNRIEELEG